MAKILVVDDEHNIRMMIRIALKASGHEVLEAVDGAQGLEFFQMLGPFDLVLLDQRMPGINGLEVLRRLKLLSDAVRVIMITAFGTVDLAAEAIQSGAADFLRKPFTAEMLRDAVGSALNGVVQPFPLAAPDDQPLRLNVSVNGYRLEPSPREAFLAADGSLNLFFVVRAASGEVLQCTVVLPAVLREVVRAYADQDKLPDSAIYWRWLGEEALANYIWQQSCPPVAGTLLLEEMTSNLRRWTQAVLSGP